ncbi:M48 family metalloprotease [Castellaniella sp.]|uniref:M48 family metalloprotease n=1 Tax=Castellaniella sp. TaxID=1955812 RepID=UPI003569BA49
MRKTGLSLCLAASLLAGHPGIHAQPVGLPSMGAASAIELSPALERLLGQAIMEQGYQDPTYVADIDINQYLSALGQRLAVHAPQPLEQDITVFAVRDPAINAFALPGGYIGVNSGLVTATESESELASVLAHEISHVMQRHIARGLEQQSQGTGIMVASLVGALLAAMAGQGDLAMGVAAFGQAAAIDRQLGFSRGAEQEADRVGLQMMQQAGFDPRGMLEMFRRLMQASRLNEGVGGGYAATHPLSIQRLSDIENRLDRLPGAAVVSNPEYWFVRTRLALLQARDNATRQRLEQSLRSQAAQQQGARKAAALYGLALLAHAAGQPDQARKDLEQARALQPAPQIDVLAIQLAAAHGPGEALRVSEQAFARWPDSQGVAYERARALQQAGKSEDAVRLLQALVRRWPHVAEFQKMLALELDRTGHVTEAHEAMATYYELRGAVSTAVEHLQQARDHSRDFYAQSRIDVRIRALRERLDTQRTLLAPFKR